MDLDNPHDSSLYSKGQKLLYFTPQQHVPLNARSASETCARFTCGLKPAFGFVYWNTMKWLSVEKTRRKESLLLGLDFAMKTYELCIHKPVGSYLYRQE